MPKQKRWHLKQQLDLAINALDRAIDNIAKTGHEFETVHPKIYDNFCAIASAIEVLKQVVEKQRDSI